MNKFSLGLLVAGASIGAFVLVRKLTNSFASFDMTDAIALMVLAAATNLVLRGRSQPS
jgi:hypothetical protein